MSNIYIQEPPALGKVLLKTSAGEIDVELWTKEAPKACRNFIQLCMEGYYNGTIFHRVVPEFIVQGGDPSGDGTGGESIYGAPFKDEFHSRLRFNRRGLIAMANSGRDDNGSQFFFTLGATPELQNKHTIFGKVTGDTIYTMLKLAEGEIGADERPVYPPRVTGASVVINPFEDIVPRQRPQQADAEEKPKKKKEKGTKNFGLLSFGAEAEEEEDEASGYRGAKSSHDLLEDPKLCSSTAAELGLTDDAPLVEEKESTETSVAVSSIREKLKRKKEEQPKQEKKEKETGNEDGSDSEGEYYLGKDRDIEKRKERERIRAEINELKKDMKKPKLDPEKEKAENLKARPETDNTLKKQYEEEQDKYRKLKEKIPKKGAARQDYTLALLEKFKSKLSALREKASESTEGATETANADDDDVNGDDWLAHKLQFESKNPVLAKDASTKGDDWFDIYDPRNPLNKRKREESERKQREKMRK